MEGPLLGAAIGWLLARSLAQQSQIEALRKQVQPHVQAPVADAAPVAAATVMREAQAFNPATAPAPASTSMPTPMPASAPVLQAADVAHDDVALMVPAMGPAPVSSPPPRPPGPPSAFDIALAAARGWLFGGNTIVKAGVAVLFIGLAFLAKLASEHVNVPIEMRLAGIAGVAIVLLVLGWRLRTKQVGYAQVLQGGAVAVLYLTLFAAFRFYGVVSMGPAFALMALVAVLAAALAVLQDARALALVGAVGGFATPLLLSSGEGNHVALFSYYLVLDLGIAAVAWFRTWRMLNLVGFAFTFGVSGAWGVLQYSPTHYATAQGFLIAFFLLFAAVALLPARTQVAGSASPGWVTGSLLFGLPTVTFGMQYGLVKDMPYGAAISALVMAAFYVVQARAMRSRPGLALAFEGSLAVGTVLLTLVIPLALDARATAGAWALEGAGLVWLGWRQARRLPRLFGYALLAVSGLLLLHAIDQHGAPTHWGNATLFSALMLVAGSLIAACVSHRHQTAAAAGTAMPGESLAEPVLIGWALVAALATSLLHVMALVQPLLRLSAMVACVSGLALLFGLLSARLQWPRVALPVLGLAPLLLLAAVSSGDLQHQPFAQGGWWAWPLALAVHALTLWRLPPVWPPGGQHLAHACGALVLAALGGLAGRGLTRELGDAGSAWPWLGWLAVPALLLLVLPRRLLLARWPARDIPLAYARSAAGVLTVLMLLWTLLANIASNGAAKPLPHVPLLNPLDLGIALALFAAWRWLVSEPARALLASTPRLPAVVLGVLGFVWLNGMLVRGFHHLGGVPFHFSAWTHSLAVQTGLTLLWTSLALALSWWSAKRGQRAPWMVGAALLGVVVAKLLLVDLSGSGTITRIVSFIGAGVLMLVIGYVAPLPGKEKSHAPA